MSARCPLYPQKRTLVERVAMSALCQKRTHALQQKTLLFDHLVSDQQQVMVDFQVERSGRLEVDD